MIRYDLAGSIACLALLLVGCRPETNVNPGPIPTAVRLLALPSEIAAPTATPIPSPSLTETPNPTAPPPTPVPRAACRELIEKLEALDLLGVEIEQGEGAVSGRTDSEICWWRGWTYEPGFEWPEINAIIVDAIGVDDRPMSDWPTAHLDGAEAFGTQRGFDRLDMTCTNTQWFGRSVNAEPDPWQQITIECHLR